MKQEFIKRVTEVRVLHFEKSDFTSTAFKKEIQHLIQTFYFPNFDLKKYTLDKLDMRQYNTAIDALKRESATNFKILHKLRPGGGEYGPGEATTYFLLNNAYLGGGTSGGVDVYSGTDKYELKAVEVDANNRAHNFRLGGKADFAHIQVQLDSMCKKYRVPGSKTDITRTSINALKKISPAEFNVIEAEYKQTVQNYFKGTKAVFISNRNRDFGHILKLMEVKAADVAIERITSNQIKPYIQL